MLNHYGTHKHPESQAWLERRPCFHLPFTPTSASWLNQVETRYSVVHGKAMRRGAFRGVAHLNDAIQRFLDAWNANRHPFVGGKTADQLLGPAKPKANSAAVR